MIFIFIGPPYSGKSTQAENLAIELGLPFFSMGKIIREAYRHGDPKAIEGFEKYSMKGKHVPTELKFHLLKDKLDKSNAGFILDNFPATKEDLEVFKQYLEEHNLSVEKVFHIFITEDEMIKRMESRGRLDDDPNIVNIRRKIQDRDRIPVLEYFKTKEVLEEIDGNSGKTIEEIHSEITSRIRKKK